MVKRVLMIAYHYPPIRGSSGIQRTLKFTKYLPDSGWEPILLSVNTRAYCATCDDQIGEIPPNLVVHRSFALDTSRHLAWKGRYPGLLALPDRWVSWWLSAIPAGLRLIRRYRPDVIWSSYPIATAHLIGLTLHRLTGIPWVADQRDPMTDTDYPPDPRMRLAFRWLENKIMAHCASLVCTTPGAIKLYQRRFPDVDSTRFCLIENGFDEENFTEAQEVQLKKDSRFILLHSGVIYPSERDPSALFAALADLLAKGDIHAGNFLLLLRATGHDDHLRELIRRHAIEAITELAPALPYKAALCEMLAADGLLLLQASNCNEQIPAKLYEYLRAARPVLALTDPAGDTAATLRAAGINTIAQLSSQAEIGEALIAFIRMARLGTAPLASAGIVASQSRAARTVQLATLLNRVS